MKAKNPSLNVELGVFRGKKSECMHMGKGF